MAYAKKYESYEVRAMLQEAEGAKSPVTGAPAHSRSLHAQAMHGGEGIDKTALTKRVDTTGLSNNQKKKLPGASSMFPNLIMQSSAAVEALNSASGQTALAEFDKAANNGKKLRMVLQVANIKEAGFLPGTMAPSVTYVQKGAAPAAQSAATTGVRIIVDRDTANNKIFIQTCIPLNTPAAATSWSVKDTVANTTLASG